MHRSYVSRLRQPLQRLSCASSTHPPAGAWRLGACHHTTASLAPPPLLLLILLSLLLPLLLHLCPVALLLLSLLLNLLN